MKAVKSAAVDAPARFGALTQIDRIEMTREDGPAFAVGALKKAGSFEEADAGLARMRRSAPEDGVHGVRIRAVYTDGAELVGVYPLQKTAGEDVETWFRRNLLGTYKAGGPDLERVKRFLRSYALGQNGVLDRCEKATGRKTEAATEIRAA